jgi:hypothetical protein
METCQSSGCSFNGDLSCTCNNRLRFCNTHYMVHKRTQGNHSTVFVQELIINAKVAERLTQIQDLKKKIISKGKTMIKAVEDQINFFFLSISLEEQKIENLLRGQDIHDDFCKALDTTIEDKGYDITTFPDIVRNYLRVTVDNQVLNPPNINIGYLIKKSIALKSKINSNKLLLEGFQSTRRIKLNIEAHLSVKISANGKHYCGKPSDLKCKCCDRRCGPNSGCNCSKCQKLDIEVRNLPKGFFVNRKGNICRIKDGVMYCGQNFCPPNQFCDGYCGPKDGPNCVSCQRMQNQVNDFLKASQ